MENEVNPNTAENSDLNPKKFDFKKWLPVGLVVVLILIFVGVLLGKNNNVNPLDVTIGIVTDLTGPAAYWGESTRVGAEIAKDELETEGYDVNLIFEDYQLDTTKALSAGQKLVNIDNVDAIYAEFNPASIALGSFLKDKDILFVYDAAPVSPLTENLNAYKTYLDYKAGCRMIAQEFKSQGIETIGVLKANWEPGELCLDGVKEVFSDKVVSESYNLGDTDFRTQVLKLKNARAEAVINTAFEGDTLNTLKAMKELSFQVPYGTVDDTITDNVKNTYPNELNGTVTFGFKDVEESFAQKTEVKSSQPLATDYAAAIAYTHIKQMVKALNKCEKDLLCVKEALDSAERDSTIGFEKFVNRIADLEMSIKKY